MTAWYSAIRNPKFPYRRFGAPGPFFFILRFWEPRSAVDLGLGGCFLRAARLAFLRSSLDRFFVFINSLVDHKGPTQLSPQPRTKPQ